MEGDLELDVRVDVDGRNDVCFGRQDGSVARDQQSARRVHAYGHLLRATLGECTESARGVRSVNCPRVAENQGGIVRREGLDDAGISEHHRRSSDTARDVGRGGADVVEPAAKAGTIVEVEALCQYESHSNLQVLREAGS